MEPYIPYVVLTATTVLTIIGTLLMSWKNSVDKRQAELATEMSEMKTNYLRRFEIVTDAINNSEKNILKEISIVNQTLASMTAQNKVSRSKGRL